jgi:periplasmic protein TonB
MKIFSNEIENLDSLVFEKRNKEYGAYAIRAEYNTNRVKSMLITAGVFLTVVGALWFFSGGKQVIKDSFSDDVLSVINVNTTPEDPKPEDPKPKAASSAAMAGEVIGRIDNDAQDHDTKDNEHQDKTVNGVSLDPDADGKSKTDSIVRVVDPQPVVEPVQVKTVIYADKMPEFIGDMVKVIQREIVYPEVAMANGTEGTVYVQFVVDEFGKISTAKVMKGIGDGCDEEAVRVVKKLADWKPGSSNGSPVRVLFNLPIKFRLGK